MFATFAVAASISITMSRALTAVVTSLGRIGLALLRCWLRHWGGRLAGSSLFSRATLDDFVQLTAIQPDASAFRAIVDLDTLALAHDKVDFAGGAKEPVAYVVWVCIGAIRHFGLLKLHVESVLSANLVSPHGPAPRTLREANAGVVASDEPEARKLGHWSEVGRGTKDQRENSGSVGRQGSRGRSTRGCGGNFGPPGRMKCR